ncbi:unnamed protein product [Urochloa humidicola]
MALVSSPPLPLPGASRTPTSPMPAPTPGPAATPKVASCSRAATSSPLAPEPSPRSPAIDGRPKALRWSNDSPPSGKSGRGAPSYVEVLRTGVCPAAASPAAIVSAAAGDVSPRSAPRVVLQGVECNESKAMGAPDADGWTYVMGRRRRGEQRRHVLWPRRSVPVDLRGKCFNCFSPNHRAANCKLKMRCFRCHVLGHRSSECAALLTRRLVWRPKSLPPPAPALAGKDVPPAPSAPGDGQLVASQGRRKRCRTRKKRSADLGRPEASSDDDVDTSVPVVSCNELRLFLA